MNILLWTDNELTRSNLEARLAHTAARFAMLDYKKTAADGHGFTR